MLKVKTSEERNAELEARLAEIENTASAEAADRAEDEVLTPEEKNWKKRHGDLRSHAQRVENALRQELADARAQLAAATKKEMNFPKSPEEVSAWAAKYPEIYDTIVTIARQNAIDVAKDTEEKVQAIQEREHNALKREAVAALEAAHPDVRDIATDQDFLDWIDTQPGYIYDAWNVNETDAFAAIRVIDLYKADRGVKKTPAPEKKPDASAANRVPRGEVTTVSNGNEPKWTESKVQKVNWNRLTPEQVQEIEEAMGNPSFYDISGGAR